MAIYSISKRMEIAAAHHLNLDYESKCENLHGHNYIVEVFCACEDLNHNGMVVDFAKLKEEIHDKLDHHYLNDVFNNEFNPTAENMAKWICEKASELCATGVCYKVTVQESEGNIAMYSREREVL